MKQEASNNNQVFILPVYNPETEDELSCVGISYYEFRLDMVADLKNVPYLIYDIGNDKFVVSVLKTIYNIHTNEHLICLSPLSLNEKLKVVINLGKLKQSDEYIGQIYNKVIWRQKETNERINEVEVCVSNTIQNTQILPQVDTVFNNQSKQVLPI
jgi:hypothetical protein